MSQPILPDDAATDTDVRKPWTTPRLDRIAFREAMSGRADNGPLTDAQQTYPS